MIAILFSSWKSALSYEKNLKYLEKILSKKSSSFVFLKGQIIEELIIPKNYAYFLQLEKLAKTTKLFICEIDFEKFSKKQQQQSNLNSEDLSFWVTKSLEAQKVIQL